MRTLMKSTICSIVAAIICGNASVEGSLHRKLAASYLVGQTPADMLSWSYDDNDIGVNGVCSEANKCGPKSWSKIVPTGTTVNECAGSNQTPININAASVVVDSTLKYPKFTEIDGGCSVWSTFTDDHALEMNFAKDKYTCTNFRITHKGIEYTLLQMHFHSPAEHTVGGGYADAEVHYVHKSAGGQFLVVGIMMDEMTNMQSSGNTMMNSFWANAKTQAALNNIATSTDEEIGLAASYQWGITSTTKMHAYDFLPGSKEYWTYPGSLTTYPCSQGITWVLMKEHVAISTSDLNIMRSSVTHYPKTIINSAGNDNRPVQPLGTRIVYSYEGVDYPEPSQGKELTRDYAAFSILVLVPIIVLLILWYFGCLACFCRNQNEGTYKEQQQLNYKGQADESKDPSHPDFIPINVL